LRHRPIMMYSAIPE